MEKWARAMYQPNLPLRESGYVTAGEEHLQLAEEAAKEGMVLLKNDNHLLPLPGDAKIALFGKGSFDYVKGGGGSGDVRSARVFHLYDGIRMRAGGVKVYEPLADFYRNHVAGQYREGAVPGMTREPELSDDLVCKARDFTDTAIIVISRFSGEGWDRSGVDYPDEDTANPWENEVTMPQLSREIFPESDFYLSGEERVMIRRVEKVFDRIAVVLNIGGVIETSWLGKDTISSVLLAWQGGMTGGLAMADLLFGGANPCGRLTDTFAVSLTDYPSTANFHESVRYVNYTEDIYVGYRYFETIPGADKRVVYPFGHGLSYTEFSTVVLGMRREEEEIRALVAVSNTGGMSGKDVVQIYYSAPQGKLKKPARELAAFVKTRLLQPGETQELELSFQVADMASYDDLGKIAKSAWILEKGTYCFYIGGSVREAGKTDFELEIGQDLVVEQLSARMVPTDLKNRLLADGTYEELPPGKSNDMNACVFEKMKPGTEEALAPAVRPCERKLLTHPYEKNVKKLIQVADGEVGIEEFLDQIGDDDLISLLGGQPNTGVANTFGFGNLPEYGVPSVMTADGPAGLRLGEECGVYTTAWPCATLLACTWNTELVERVGRAGAEEVKENNLSVWLTPAVNIHRNPLCGRNFEYYSEDPYISGKMGAAMVRGIQSQKIAAAVKHFSANNKETNRKHSDSRVSERALREIYLRAFEIIVKEADPWVIMSSYNAVNGHRASENHELLENILRGEWHFGGVVTSDWWTRGEHYKEIKAGNDIKMATGFPERVKKAMQLGALDREDLKRCARRVLGLILKLE
ncbi:MAG: glycoside hydrolase family 3 C-terminal domain-containing protein [Clostridiales bacterium]|nr:glycoside hydrolase family 3 C-terminal domain-containing protein [Clostridiales bacterium]